MYINYTELKLIQAFSERPSEMVRRLLLCLVGQEQLKTMTAKGTKLKKDGDEKKKNGIPEDIFNAVFCKHLLLANWHFCLSLFSIHAFKAQMELLSD